MAHHGLPFAAAGDSFTAGKPRLFLMVRFTPGVYHWFDVHPDGRLMMAKAADDSAGLHQVTMVFNLPQELRRMAAPARSSCG
jgi:hypothetical protein